MTETQVLSNVNIVSTPNVLGGKPRIEGRRISVQHVAQYHVQAGWSVEEIAEAFDLTLAEIYAALSYYYAHKDEIDRSLAERQAEIEKLKEERQAAGGEGLSDVLTPPAVAQTYNLSPRTVRDAIEHGWIPAHKVGGTWLIRREDAAARWGDRLSD